MKKPKYIGKIIKKEFVTLDINGNPLDIQPTPDEKLMDDIFNTPQKYMYVDLFTKVGEVMANTLTDLNTKAYNFVEQNHLGFDFEVFVVK